MQNETIHNPATGETLYVIEPNEEVFRFVLAIDPGCGAAELVHPTSKRTIRVTEGELRCRVDGVERTLKAGESIVVPAGSAHCHWNPTGREARAIGEFRPAGDAHNFFRVAFALARDGHVGRKGAPKPVIGAALLSEFGGFVRPASLYSQVLVAVLGPVSRLLGIDRTIRKYVAKFERQDAQHMLESALAWWIPSSTITDPFNRAAEEAFWS